MNGDVGAGPNRQIIMDLALKIAEESKLYQLTRVVFALQDMVNSQVDINLESNNSKDPVIIDEFVEELTGLAEKNKMKNNDFSNLIAKTKNFLSEFHYNQKKVRIQLEYVEEINEKASRVVKRGNVYYICLPKKLIDQVKMYAKEGNFKNEALEKLRELLGHEIGHLALHFGLLNVKGYVLPDYPFGVEYECEANHFSKILIDSLNQ
ncbi:MAG: hypothetical protein FWE90_10425 [Defluviitaleaceae bacterium]|nr:hypothetical protein [Defluviitaleaceae bacterium]